MAMASRSVFLCRPVQTLTLTLTLTLTPPPPPPRLPPSSVASAAARSSPSIGWKMRRFPSSLSSSSSSSSFSAPPELQQSGISPAEAVSASASPPITATERNGSSSDGAAAEPPPPSLPVSSSEAAAEAEAGGNGSSSVDALDIRVGRILKAWRHPEADTLYVEEVDVGEPDGPRTICSGLVKFLTVEELQERNVIVLANLKPRNMRGVKSNGMLLAASDATHENVELLIPPEGSIPGERVWFGTEDDKASQGESVTPNQLQKKKIWEAIQPLLKTSEDSVVTFNEKPMRTSAGFVTCKSLKGANVG